MSQEYQVIARKYRPQRFSEVVGQGAIVTTLKNSIKQGRIAHAFLFSGSHGTGKTTLARIFAKAINCQSLNEDLEPCNQCPSCTEITHGHSLDVIEIDGASHRGIDDIRAINETVNFAPASGKYKIYIIDEVHMLTKEAFNALLKTLEEPPPKVKFFFATTEAHKLPATIISRCQRYLLKRISQKEISEKLGQIVNDFGRTIEDEALHLLAVRAQGGLRDAESLLDQLIASEDNAITAKATAELLGVMPQEVFYALDQAGKEGNLIKAFEISHQIYTEGKNSAHFVEMLAHHLRTLLMIKLSGAESNLLEIPESEKEKLTASAALYRKEQLVQLLDELVAKQQEIRFAPSERALLEMLLLRILKSHNQVPVEYLVKRLVELENSIPKTPVKETPPPKPQVTVVEPPPKKKEPVALDKNEQTRYDTIMQFAAVELDGTLQKGQ